MQYHIKKRNSVWHYDWITILLHLLSSWLIYAQSMQPKLNFDFAEEANKMIL